MGRRRGRRPGRPGRRPGPGHRPAAPRGPGPGRLAGPAAAARATAAWRYAIAWEPLPAPPAALAGTWLVVAPPGPEAAGLAGQVAAAVAAQAGTRWPSAPGRPWRRAGAALAAALADAGSGSRQDLAGVVSLLALDAGRPPASPRCPPGWPRPWPWSRRGRRRDGAPLWVLTRGAVSSRPRRPGHQPGPGRRSGAWAGSPPWSTPPGGAA